MPDFFVYLMCLCGQKSVFLIKTLVFGAHFGVHIWIFFPLIAKALRAHFSKDFFSLEFKLHQIHLVRHELIREMGINTPNKAFRTVPHPSIYNIRSYILHTGHCKDMAQKILCIPKHAKNFGGTLDDPDVMKLCGCSRNSYYKYKREIKNNLGL